MEPLEVDQLIDLLLTSKKPDILATVKQQELGRLANTARKLFLSQPMLLELQGPITICGDIHGQYKDLVHVFNLAKYPSETNFLFLGDYVDRGKNSLEVITLLLCFKIKYPNRFFLLRGNHEQSSINRIYGFYDECKRRYSVKLWKVFTNCFNCLPISAVVSDKILCMHGGLSPHLHHLGMGTPSCAVMLVNLMCVGDILNFVRPTEIPDDGLLTDILWSDPGTHSGWEENNRYAPLILNHCY